MTANLGSDWLIFFCASSYSRSKNTALRRDTCSKTMLFRAACILHPHLPELVCPPRARRHRVCSLAASPMHSCLHLAPCCTKSYSSAQPRKPAKGLGSPFLALALPCCGVLAMLLVASPPRFACLRSRQYVLRRPVSPSVFVAVTCLKFLYAWGPWRKGCTHPIHLCAAHICRALALG